jgi:hypothetical protein
MALLVDESQSSASSNAGSMQVRQPPFSIYLFHRPTATPAAIAVRNSVISLCPALAPFYQLGRIMMGLEIRVSLRMRWNRTGA